ncbi:MAG: molybdopterin-dependent oxidoreductase [Ignavibacteriales bacterium]|nr:molybdopterin-dependent oxidoreductase [Ignavibacteriales bacterium]
MQQIFFGEILTESKSNPLTQPVLANTSATAASSAADLNGKAVEIACSNILERLKKSALEILKRNESDQVQIKDEIIFVNGKATDLSWKI